MALQADKERQADKAGECRAGISIMNVKAKKIIAGAAVIIL